MQILDKEYLKEHLKEYIAFQLNQGYELADVKQALIKYGYAQKFVDDMCKGVHHEPVREPFLKHTQEELDTDAYNYVLNMLIDYMSKELKQGYSLAAIQKALINYGHMPKVVHEAAAAIQKGTVGDYEKSSAQHITLPSYLVFSLTLLIAFAGVFFLSIVTNTSIVIILFNFIPTLLSLTIVYAALISFKLSALRRLLPLGAVAATVGIFILLVQYSTLLRATHMPTILLLNAALTFVCSLILCIFSRVEDVHLSKKKPKKEHRAETQKEAAEAKHKPLEGMQSLAQRYLEKAGIGEAEESKEKKVRELP